MKNLRILFSIILIIAVISGCINKSNKKLTKVQEKDVVDSHTPFSDARIIIEVNSTDGDSGIQVFLDGEGWDFVDIIGPDGTTIFDVMGKGSVSQQGITEFFFESAEPSFNELPLNEFLSRFPEGEYKFLGITTAGTGLLSTATLTHVLPCGPEIISPEKNDEVSLKDTYVTWKPVTKVFDANGTCKKSNELEIVGYRVVVEREEPKPQLEFNVNLPPTVTMIKVPAQFLLPGTEYKFEVLAVEASGNQTITESTFSTYLYSLRPKE